MSANVNWHIERLETDVVRPLTVVVCTHNRSRDAMECIDAVLKEPAGRSVPVLLVDSASESGHAEALDEYSRQYENIELIRSDIAGLSVARNLAVDAVDSAWVAFLDDDARPQPGWLDTAQRIAEESPEDLAVVGGRILPGWPGDRPSNLGWRWLMFLSCIEEPQQDPEDPIPRCYGANLMLRRSAVREVGGFAVELGRVGGRLLSGEESLLLYQLFLRGFKVRYRGDLIVEHNIEPERLTVGWVRKRAFWGGVSEVVGAHVFGSRYPPHLNPIRAAAAMVVFTVVGAVRDPQSDFTIRAHYARGILTAWWWSRSRPSWATDGEATGVLDGAARSGSQK
jgi:glucosyl-dolichyl phosphate glucuronosyltransferase